MFKIGFYDGKNTNGGVPAVTVEAPCSAAPRKSVVQILFSDNGTALDYYNDKFDLRIGNMVYVDGKMEGVCGRVVGINYNFKIKLSEYKRVIALVDTDVHGAFFIAGSHFVTFDPAVLPAQKVRPWFLPIARDEEEYITGSDDTAFPLGDLGEIKIAPQIISRGHEYYAENRVEYLSLNGTHGYAIVRGTKPYEVEFELRDGMISELTCSCFCNYNCKHAFAVMLQLRETLELIDKHYADRHSGYFAAVLKGTLFSVAVDSMETGSFQL